jgi:hypothetical protein
MFLEGSIFGTDFLEGSQEGVQPFLEALLVGVYFHLIDGALQALIIIIMEAKGDLLSRSDLLSPGVIQWIELIQLSDQEAVVLLLNFRPGRVIGAYLVTLAEMTPAIRNMDAREGGRTWRSIQEFMGVILPVDRRGAKGMTEAFPAFRGNRRGH